MRTCVSTLHFKHTGVFLLLPATQHHPERTELVSVYHWRAPLTPDWKFRYWNVSEMDLVSFQCQVSHFSASGSEFHCRTGLGQLAQHLDPNSLLNVSGPSQVLRLNTLLNTAHYKLQQRHTSHQSDQWEPLVSQETPRRWLQALVFTDQNSDQAPQVSYKAHTAHLGTDLELWSLTCCWEAPRIKLTSHVEVL